MPGTGPIAVFTTRCGARRFCWSRELPVFVSSNLDGGDEKNADLYKKYYGYWK